MRVRISPRTLPGPSRTGLDWSDETVTLGEVSVQVVRDHFATSWPMAVAPVFGAVSATGSVAGISTQLLRVSNENRRGVWTLCDIRACGQVTLRFGVPRDARVRAAERRAIDHVVLERH